MVFTHRHLLQWTSSDYINRSKQKNLLDSYIFMWVEPVLGICAMAYVFYLGDGTLDVAVPILTLWIVAPFITWWVSKPLPIQAARLNEEATIFLQALARKTWAFFEKFVTAEENWLPPDNFQEAPAEVIAHRTSPTNIGLSLLSNLAAYDFGYMNCNEFIERTSATMHTMEMLERYKGHFYNWYDTHSLKPLWPRYISTVDSGNLASHLLTLRQGIMEMADAKIMVPKLTEGILDTLRVLVEKSGEESSRSALIKFMKDAEKLFQSPLVTPGDFKKMLEELQSKYAALQQTLSPDIESETNWWKERLATQIQKHLDDLKLFIPWLFLPALPGNFNSPGILNGIPTLKELAHIDISSETEMNRLRTLANTPEEKEWLSSFEKALTEASKHANEIIGNLNRLARQCNELSDIEFDFLYDRTKNLLTIGYNIEEHRTDASYYDLLASEARLTAFLGVSQGKLPQESWFSLSRLLTNAGGRPILLSWGGSMFEYLMPLLVMPSYANTLLKQTDEAAVERQIEYGTQRGVPWGMSESGYNMVDTALNYQYRAFGVPGLGLKRGLGEDLVVAPYASVLALMVAPVKTYENIREMVRQGFEGKYGFYEAVDYTTSRLPRGQKNAIIQSYMAHHQGMSILALAYLLLDKPMQKRFEAEPQFQATLLLLQERIPKATSFFAHTTNIADIISPSIEPEIRVIKTPNTPIPEIQLLSNGKYHVMVTNSGGGYSRWKDLAVTRWREDTTRDHWGFFCYIRDVEKGAFWSTAFQPTLKRGKNYEAAFSQGRADFRDTQDKIETHIEIVVSPEDDIEMRRLHITNRTGKRKIIDVTSYAEVVLAPAIGDALHPAFSNLFVQTEIQQERKSIFCTRRPGSADEKQPWMFHIMEFHDKEPEEVSYETDRLEFIGRGNSVSNPAAMNKKGPLPGNQGSVLDPIVSIRKKISLAPEETITVDMIIGIGETREICENLTNKYQDKHHKDRVFELAWTHSQVVLRQINATESDAKLFSRMASSVLFINPTLRAEASTLFKNQRGQSGLWPYSISGDLPIVLLKIEENTDIEFVKQLIQAHTYWRLKGLVVDLVIWNDSRDGYRQVLQNEIAGLIATQTKDVAGGIFVRASEQIPNEDRILFQTVARVIITSGAGSLVDQVKRKAVARVTIPDITPAQPYEPSVKKNIPLPPGVLFYNGIGGFSPDGREYIISTEGDKMTPVPWSNVLANPNFGTVISESGQSYTWSENAHEMRLTPWENDPVCDPGGEQFYIRDEETGYFWSATPLPKKSQSGYITRHGFGYSVFAHEEEEIHSEMCVYVDLESPVKFTTIKLKNNTDQVRRLTVTGYTEWVLGDLKTKSAMYIVTELDSESGAVIAKNPYNTEFPERVAFFDAEAINKTFTGDRNEFIGRNGSLRNPAALSRTRLSGRVGAGLDPCAAIQVSVELAPGEEKEIVFKLGSGKNAREASNLIRQFRSANSAHQALEKVKDYWNKTINALHIETPDTSLNLLANGWLTYQTIASRLWARTGYYQSSGAFGFRDQLQDVLSLLHVQPGLARKQILLSASRQFKEGDVQHWWHPPIGRGIRTRCSDDFLWLPYVVCRYVVSTSDKEVLNELIPFLAGRPLNPGEESYYDLVAQSDEKTSLYDHCVRAVKHGLRYGIHGLPLMGTGDWNDGMDRVGRNGKGESIWLAFFLYDILIQFIPVAQMQNDPDFALQCEAEAKTLKENIDKNGWDGNWYRRAYFDDGTPLGSAGNEECRIDSIAQSWSVLSGAGTKERTALALESADKNLVDDKNALVKLLTPPFDKSAVDPGYIKGYVPGVRENGGQYTHAAAWLTMAFARSGNNKRAWELMRMINPINHTKSSKDFLVYMVEPFVIAADVYAESPHTGRGGWTWYTGSAGWIYQLITESLLGIKQENGKLRFSPCVPSDWKSFKVRYRYGDTFYQISFLQEQGNEKLFVKMDGKDEGENAISLLNDGNEHQIEVRIFSKSE
jgi:cyclic beta-1,2-glucan synthetase